MSETSPTPNNKAVAFEGKPTVEREWAALKGRVTSKASALRKRGLISDSQAEKRGLAMTKTPADGEMANLTTAS